ncbi:MAG: hypothetical protein ACRD1W_00205 [Vicinamibacterales bacterium]
MYFACAGAGTGGGEAYSDTTFSTEEDGEAVALLTVDCDACAWHTTGSEAVVLAITLDDRPPVHMPIVRTGEAEYRVLLGRIGRGRHTATARVDPDLTSASLRAPGTASFAIDVEQIPTGSDIHQAISLAPFIYARPDTVGTFTDLPLLMWYEVEPTDRGSRYRYSVIFSNEDGGTPADRLMATWGRTTDIEYLYSAEVDASGAILAEDMQGPDHKILPFQGKREGGHPLLWVSTENNMVLDHGTTTVRYAPAPSLITLDQVSRETVMDANPWTYEVMARELAREGKIVADPPPGTGAIPDLRRFVFIEACGEAGTNAITASVNVGGAWHSSDRGVAEYRIVRDGCFRAAIPVPASAAAREVSAIRFQAHARKDRAAGTSRITRLNRVFSLDERFTPGTSVMQWEGSASLIPGGKPFDIPVR